VADEEEVEEEREDDDEETEGGEGAAGAARGAASSNGTTAARRATAPAALAEPSAAAAARSNKSYRRSLLPPSILVSGQRQGVGAAAAAASAAGAARIGEAAGAAAHVGSSGSLGNALVSSVMDRSEARRLLMLSFSPDGRSTGSPLHVALAHPSQAGKRAAMLRSLFAVIDVDRSGGVELQELRRYTEDVAAKMAGLRARLQQPAGAASGSTAAGAGTAVLAALSDEEVAPDGVPLAIHMAVCGVLLESGSVQEEFTR
jgi:hypothetical protein